MNPRILATVPMLFAFAACERAVTSPKPQALPPQAAVVTNTQFDLSPFFIGNPCPPAELVDIVQGFAHVKTQLTTSASGRVMLRFSVNWQGVDGIGLVTGLKYQIQDNADFSINAGAGGAFVLDSDVVLRANRQGSADNLYIDARLHVTFNANGVLTSFKVDPFGIECRG
ncbi:MAG: hypothetical protein ACREMM_09450 [Gemmatimonadales bacterium]